MARIEAHCDLALDLTVFTVTGSVTAEQFVEAVKTNYGRHPTRNAIWDLRQGRLSSIDMAALIAMSDIAKAFAAKRGKPRTVFVVEREPEALLIRLYEQLLSMGAPPIECALVASLDEALAMLASEAPFGSAAIRSAN